MRGEVGDETISVETDLDGVGDEHLVVERVLVLRQDDPLDRRSVILSLSAEGRRSIAAIRRKRDAWMASRVARLTPEEQDVLARATVILTTHILEVAERMADRVGIIEAGKLRTEGTLDELRAQAGGRQSTLEELFLDLVGRQEHAEAAPEPA